MPKRFYRCAACMDDPPQPFNRLPTPAAQCVHCHLWNRTWIPVDDKENLVHLQKKSFILAAFGGTWTSGESNVGGDATTRVANLYGGKHFDRKKQKDAAKFNEDLTQGDVAGLEDKAVRIGLEVPGARIFRFSANIGTDGTVYDGTTNLSQCLRVDSIGTTGMHSHPIPENRCAAVNHKKLVCERIIHYANNGDLAGLLKVAQYLTIIGAGRGEFVLNRDESRKLNDDADLRGCVFWT